MTSFDPAEATEATERISIEGEEALVYHARNPDLDQQEFADHVYELADGYEFEDNDTTDDRLLEDTPPLGVEVHNLTKTGFAMEFHEDDEVSADQYLAVSDTYDYFVYDEDSWKHATYSHDDPSDADIIAAYLSLVNAAWSVNNLENYVENDEGVDTGELFTEGYFNAKVTQGLMLAFRDAFSHRAPHSALQGMYFHDSDYAIVDAIQNTLGLELTETHLHGLLLAEWNKDVNLQAASQYGKEKSVEEGMNALEGIANALDSEE